MPFIVVCIPSLVEIAVATGVATATAKVVSKLCDRIFKD